MGKTLDITVTVFGVVIKIFLAFVFALYLLAQKEQWKKRSKRFLYAYLPEKTVKRVMEILSLSNTSFTNFVTGQILDALVIGFLCYIGMLLAVPLCSVLYTLVQEHIEKKKGHFSS